MTDQLSPEQIKMFAEMYAEKEGLTYDEGCEFELDTKVTETWHWHDAAEDCVEQPDFNDLNIIMGLLEWHLNQAEGGCYRHYRYSGGGHGIEIDDYSVGQQVGFHGTGPTLIIAIAEALEKIKE